MPPLWFITKDGDEYCRALYERHYSRKGNKKHKLFVGPGEKIVLRTWEGDAVFVWNKCINDNGQQGINCTIFRNESQYQSSELIRQADAIAFEAWPSERHFTYINASKIKSTNAGFCFKAAGWRRCGITKVNKLIILEKLP